MSSINNISNPIVDFSKFNSNCREEGLSGFIRARNEGEYLAESIESWLPLLDELIIVFNNCQDNTEAIARTYAEKYPQKIKVFHYLPIVYPQGSEKYKELDSNNIHSLVNYYNFALSHTTKKWAIKIDGDLILENEMISYLRKEYLSISRYSQNSFLPISGVNIILQNNLYYLPSSSKFCGTAGDLCMFKVDIDTTFQKGENSEYLNLSNRLKLNNIFAYYHLKFAKNDFGVGNYNFRDNPNSRYLMKTIIAIFFMRLIPFEEVVKKYKLHPLSSVGLNHIKSKIINRVDYKKETLKYINFNISMIFNRIFLSELKLYLYLKITNSKLAKYIKKNPKLAKIIKVLLRS